jgi:nucleoside-diphosphate-sugar epimerase
MRDRGEFRISAPNFRIESGPFSRNRREVKILFIGGTGNISTDCAALLSARGHEIQVVSRGKSVVPREYRVFLADRRDPQAMRRVISEAAPEVVINFLGYELEEVQLDYELFQRRARQYVFISSATVYAKPHTVLPLREDAPLGNPWWEYARKKQACEEWLRERFERDGFPVTIIRPSHTYSKKWVPNPVSSSSYTFASRLERGRPVYVHDLGETLWTLTASSDFAEGLAGLVGLDASLGEAVHITSDEALSWNQIYAEIAAALGVPTPEVVKIPTDFICQVAPRFSGSLKGDKAHAGVFDNTKIKRLVPGFQARKPFRIGVRESIAYLREHPLEQNLSAELEQTIENIIAAWKAAPSGSHE